MSIGAVLDEAWTLFTRFFLRFFLLAAIVFGTLNLVYALMRRSRTTTVDGALLLFAISSRPRSSARWLQGAFVYAVQDARDGTFDSSSEVFARVSPSVGRSSWRVSSPGSGSRSAPALSSPASSCSRSGR